MGSILTWLASSALGPLIQGGLKAYQAKLDSTNSHEAKTVELYARELALDTRQAELNTVAKGQIRDRWYAPENLMFYLVALPYYFKAVTVDNTLGSIWDLGLSTPGLHGDTAATMSLVMAFWFGKKAMTSVAEIIGATFGRK